MNVCCCGSGATDSCATCLSYAFTLLGQYPTPASKDFDIDGDGLGYSNGTNNAYRWESIIRPCASITLSGDRWQVTLTGLVSGVGTITLQTNAAYYPPPLDPAKWEITSDNSGGTHSLFDIICNYTINCGDLPSAVTVTNLLGNNTTPYSDAASAPTFTGVLPNDGSCNYAIPYERIEQTGGSFFLGAMTMSAMSGALQIDAHDFGGSLVATYKSPLVSVNNSRALERRYLEQSTDSHVPIYLEFV